MIYHLRFPHNIERLVFDHALEMQDQHDIYQAVKKSNEIELAVAQWFDNQQRPMQILAAALTLFPDNSTSDIQDFYFHVCRELKVTDDGLLKLAKRSAGYIRLNVRADLAYPSYTEGIMETLWNVDLHLAWELIRLRAEHVSGNNLTALIQCRRAIQLLNRNERISVASPMSHSLADEDYFTRFVATYNNIIKRNFSLILSSFLPKWDGEARIHIDYQSNKERHCWAILRCTDNEPPITTSINRQIDRLNQLGEIDVEARDRTRYAYPTWHYEAGVNRDIPQIAALDKVVEQLQDALNSFKAEDKSFLSEGWHLRTARLLLTLESAKFPFESISPENPLTAQRLDKWAASQLAEARAGTLLQSFPPTRFYLTPDEIMINNLHPGSAVNDLETLADEGHPLTGGLLIPQDVEWEAARGRLGGLSLSDVYSDSQLCKATEHGIRLVFEAYKATIE